MCKKIFNKLTAFLLCLITAVGCSVMVINTPKTAKVSAESWGGYDYDLEEINSYLDNQDISDEEIEGEQERIHDKYEEYIQFDGAYLNYEELPYYSTYREAFPPFPYEEIENNDDIYIDYLYSLGLYEEDIQNIIEERNIIENIDLMNEAVTNEEGYIDGDELILYDLDAENYARWRAWNFKLKWYMLSVNFDADFAILFSISFLIIDILSYELQDVKEFIQNLQTDAATELLMQAFFYIPNNLAAQLVALKSNEAIAYLITLVPDIVSALTSKNIALKIMRIILSKLLPGIKDCLITLFYGLIENRGCYFQFCWFPYKTKLGLKIQPL